MRAGLHSSLKKARSIGVADESIALDVGIGFGKTVEQNLELIAKFDAIAAEFEGFPVMIGTSRKSFIGKMLGGAPADERLGGSIATAVIAAWNGAKIIRVHDVKHTVDALRMVETLRTRR